MLRLKRNIDILSKGVETRRPLPPWPFEQPWSLEPTEVLLRVGAETSSWLLCGPHDSAEDLGVPLVSCEQRPTLDRCS